MAIPQHSLPTAIATPALRAWRWATNAPEGGDDNADHRVQYWRMLPFAALHASCLAVLWTGVSKVAVAVAVFAYLARMFFITAFYHRYFSHRSFQAGRAMRFAMAVLGCTAGQRGPLWWTAHHRAHHAGADTASDPHSPRLRGFLHSHMLWFFTGGAFGTDRQRIRDWEGYPELALLERLWWLPFIAFGAGTYWLGEWLAAVWPATGTSGAQMLVWAGCISTVALYHATYTINSLAHRWGSRRFDTADDSRNNALLALLTLGEGWHNNHHRYPASARQGFYPGEIDISYLLLRLLSGLGLVARLRPVPARILAEGRAARPAEGQA